MKQEHAVEAMSIAVQVGQSVMLWGHPGIGKTKAIEAMGAAMGMPVETIIASLREPADFAGLPVVLADGVHLAPPAWAQRMHKVGRGILFFDELSTAPPAVQAALLRVVEERVVGELRLSEKVAVIAAANPPESAAGGWDLAPPTANRFIHIDWPADVEAFKSGIVAGWRTAEFVRRVPDGWREHRPRYAALVSAFLNVRAQLAYAMPQNDDARGQAWPSFRSWEKAIDLIAAADAAQASENCKMLLVSGAIGPAAAHEFFAYSQKMDLPDPEDALRDPTTFKLPSTGDRALAAALAIAGAVISNKTPERWENGVRALMLGSEPEQRDVVAVAVRQLTFHRPPGSRVPEEVGELLEMLQRAGLLDPGRR